MLRRGGRLPIWEFSPPEALSEVSMWSRSRRSSHLCRGFLEAWSERCGLTGCPAFRARIMAHVRLSSHLLTISRQTPTCRPATRQGWRWRWRWWWWSAGQQRPQDKAQVCPKKFLARASLGSISPANDRRGKSISSRRKTCRAPLAWLARLWYPTRRVGQIKKRWQSKWPSVSSFVDNDTNSTDSIFGNTNCQDVDSKPALASLPWYNTSWLLCVLEQDWLPQ